MDDKYDKKIGYDVKIYGNYNDNGQWIPINTTPVRDQYSCNDTALTDAIKENQWIKMDQIS